MDKNALQQIATGSASQCLISIQRFNSNHKESKSFTDIDRKTKDLLWDAIFLRLEVPGGGSDETLTRDCLNSIRLLSREKFNLAKSVSTHRLKILMALSGLGSPDEQDGPQQLKLIEGLKVIFNMVFQSNALQIEFIKHGILARLTSKIQEFMDPATKDEYTLEYQYFVCRVLFLLTALSQDLAIPKVMKLYNGFPLLTDYLEACMEEMQVVSSRKNSEDITMMGNTISEVLKVLYNLIAYLVPKNERLESPESEIDTGDMEHFKRITRTTRELILSNAIVNNATTFEFPVDATTKEEICRHSIDILSAIPALSFPEFVPEIPVEKSCCEFVFEGHDMTAVEETLQYLNARLDDAKQAARPADEVSSSLLALHNMAINCRLIRKYLKKRILPPLKRSDVEKLPEEGTTLRNKLVALLTSPASYIAELASNLLFILCKEKVGRMIKYTGYGNAAGMLAKRGLMLGGLPPAGKYSDSDSEEKFDHDDYAEIEHMMNHIEGRLKQMRPDPMEGMTEEQKEHEAIKLINAIDKMDRQGGGIRPCRIGADGRPVPIKHVLQLQEELETGIKGVRREEDSDSD